MILNSQLPSTKFQIYLKMLAIKMCLGRTKFPGNIFTTKRPYCMLYNVYNIIHSIQIV